MRTIEFRGKSLYGDWLYGSLCVHSDQTASIQSDGLWRAVETETIGQLTNNYDTDGNEIYVGDVLRGYKVGESHKPVDRVVEYDSCGNLRARRIGDYAYHDERDCCKVNEVVGIVIGNIHDNPELLSNSK